MSITDRAPEPSMEEILSSIRRIISDDSETPSSGEEASSAAPAPEPVSTPEPEASVELVAEVEEVAEPEPEMDMAMAMEVAEEVKEPAPEPADEDDDIFELTNVVEPVESDSDFEVADCGADIEDDIEFVSVETEEPEEPEEPEIMALPELGPEPVLAAETPAESDAADRLVSDNVGVAAAASFGDLANTLLSRGDSASTVEELVQEMLRPLLKGWLDANLPTLVEKLVSEEIERIARRGR